jgi:hypothetical protein
MDKKKMKSIVATWAAPAIVIGGLYVHDLGVRQTTTQASYIAADAATRGMAPEQAAAHATSYVRREWFNYSQPTRYVEGDLAEGIGLTLFAVGVYLMYAPKPKNE